MFFFFRLLFIGYIVSSMLAKVALENYDPFKSPDTDESLLPLLPRSFAKNPPEFDYYNSFKSAFFCSSSNSAYLTPFSLYSARYCFPVFLKLLNIFSRSGSYSNMNLAKSSSCICNVTQKQTRMSNLKVLGSIAFLASATSLLRSSRS